MTRDEIIQIVADARAAGKVPDLRSADLREADLAGACLHEADLTGADLAGADLDGANLAGANLHGANLAGANLHGANLRGANLTRADLSGANLTGADLDGANLAGANLAGANLAAGANLHGANLRGANLTRADLSGANLTGADLDFAAWPLWCGSNHVRVDERLAAQLAAHFCALECDNPTYLRAAATLLPIALTSHRADDMDISLDRILTSLRARVEFGPSDPGLLEAAKTLIKTWPRDELPDWVEALANSTPEALKSIIEIERDDMRITPDEGRVQDV